LALCGLYVHKPGTAAIARCVDLLYMRGKKRVERRYGRRTAQEDGKEGGRRNCRP